MTAATLHRVFVFGTLKQGFPNFHVNRGRRLPGDFRTALAYPLYLVGERHSPWLLDQPGQGQPVRGQLFEVDDGVLADMDRLERVTEPDGYRRVAMVVVDEADGRRLEVQAYLKDPGQLVAALARVGPLPEFTLAHAALYRPRAD